MKASRSVSDIDSSSPRNSPNLAGSMRCWSRKWLRSVGRSFTTPTATLNASPWPTLRSSISEQRDTSWLLCTASMKRGFRGTKKGTQQVVRSLASPRTPPWPSLAGRPCRAEAPGPWKTSLIPGSVHTAAAVAPLLFLAVASALCCSSSTTSGRRPISAATCRGVQPAVSIASGAAPWCRSSRTTAQLPLRQAACSSVVPWESRTRMSAPIARSHRTAERFAVPAKRNTSWSRSGRPSRVSLNTVPAGSQSGSLDSVRARPSSSAQRWVLQLLQAGARFPIARSPWGAA
mmetsp:Transcript_34809/g.100030  ORF Transcript_34809/g.100030 Transcript_34809/m.100030 type:complete len:289 (+) Transcript_34809:1602-2468(+)